MSGPRRRRVPLADPDCPDCIANGVLCSVHVRGRAAAPSVERQMARAMTQHMQDEFNAASPEPTPGLREADWSDAWAGRLHAAATRLVEAHERQRDALNGLGHPGVEHDKTLHMPLPGVDYDVFDEVGDCAACGGAQYGADYEMNDCVGDVRAALGMERRAWETCVMHRDDAYDIYDHLAALAASPAPEPGK